jgi:hypothetical protein
MIGDTSTNSFWGHLAFTQLPNPSISHGPTRSPEHSSWNHFYDLLRFGHCPEYNFGNEPPIKFNSHDKETYISEYFYNHLKKHSMIVDGTEGGLVLGLPHSSGGVQIIRKTPNGILIAGEMEGDEYLINSESCVIYSSRLGQINNEFNHHTNSTPLPDFTFPDNITKIVTFKRILEVSAESQFIVNTLATQRHYQELEDINNYPKEIRELTMLRDSITHPMNRKTKKWYQFWK